MFSLTLFSENESGKIHYFEKVTGEYYDIFGNVDGGVRVIKWFWTHYISSRKIYKKS